MGLNMISSYVPDLQSNPEMFAALRNYASMGLGSIFLFLFSGCGSHSHHTKLGGYICHSTYNVYQGLDYI